MPIRAKFRCVRKIQSTSAYGSEKPVEQEEVELRPVTGPGNEEWSKWTPGGQLQMQISNPVAIAQLEVGKDYFIDITPVQA